MNGKRLAFIYADPKKTSDFYDLKTGLFEAFKYLPKNIEARVFVRSEQMNVLQEDHYDIYFRNSLKALNYSIKEVFEPTHTFVIGGADSNIDDLYINPKKPKYLIHKGKKHKKELSKIFDKVIVEIPEDKPQYDNAIYKSVVNTNAFVPKGNAKFFTVCYPQSLVNTTEIELFEKARVWGSISADLDTEVKLPLHSTVIRNEIFNQSMAVVLLSDEDSVETALSALACNIPVVATKDIKASLIPGVLVSNASTTALINTTYKALNMKYNFRDSYITPNFNPKSYAEMIVDLAV